MNDNHEPAPSIFIEDLDAIIPMVIEIIQSRPIGSGDEHIEGINLWASMEAATSKDYKAQCAGIIAEDINMDALPPSTWIRIHAAIKTQEELTRRHRVLDDSLNATLRSIMSVSL